MLIIDRFLSQLVSTNSFHWAACENWWINKLLNCCRRARRVCDGSPLQHRHWSAVCSRIVRIDPKARGGFFPESLFKSLFHPEIINLLTPWRRVNLSGGLFWGRLLSPNKLLLLRCRLLTYIFFIDRLIDRLPLASFFLGKCSMEVIFQFCK